MTLGLVRDGRAEVVEGVSAGDAIIVAGLDRVVPSQPVNVVEGLAQAPAEPEAAPTEATP